MANGIASVLVSSGLVLLPLAMVLWRNWSEPLRSQSARDAAAVSLRRMEQDALIGAVVLVAAFLPAIPVSRGDLKFDAPYTETPTSPQASLPPYAEAPEAIETIRVPLLWWLVYHVSGAVTHRVVSLIEVLDDPAVLRASLLRIAELSISDEGLIAELALFRRDCYEPALAKYQRDPNRLQAANDFEAVDWVGSHIFVRTEGYYRACPDIKHCGASYHASAPVPGWPSRFAPDIAPGQPRCDSWWAEDGLGLRARLLADLHAQAPWFKRHTQRVIDSMDDERLKRHPDVVSHFEDRVLRRMLNQVPRIMVERADREAGIFFNSLSWLSADGLQQLAGTLGALVLSLILHIIMELVVVGLPMLQALLLMLLYVALPLVVPYAVVQPGIILRAVLVMFSLRFLSALWAIAEFLDEKLLKTMYPDSSIFEFGGSGTVADVVLGLITLVAYLTLPVAWFMLVAALGSKATRSLAGSWGQAASRLEQSGSESARLLAAPLRGRPR